MQFELHINKLDLHVHPTRGLVSNLSRQPTRTDEGFFEVQRCWRAVTVRKNYTKDEWLCCRPRGSLTFVFCRNTRRRPTAASNNKREKMFKQCIIKHWSLSLHIQKIYLSCSVAVWRSILFYSHEDRRPAIIWKELIEDSLKYRRLWEMNKLKIDIVARQDFLPEYPRTPCWFVVVSYGQADWQAINCVLIVRRWLIDDDDDDWSTTMTMIDRRWQINEENEQNDWTATTVRNE
jgi:hypothetical protein